MTTTSAAESHPSLPAVDVHNPTPTLSSITLNSKEPIRAELYGLESLRARARSGGRFPRPAAIPRRRPPAAAPPPEPSHPCPLSPALRGRGGTRRTARARRRMAARQFPHRRGRFARGPPRPAARLLQGAAQARRAARSPACRASTPWPWRWSPTATAASTRATSPASSRRSRRSRR